MTVKYISSLDEFCHKFILKGQYKPSQEDTLLFAGRLRNIQSEIFESLMLFDRVNFRVTGENVPLSMLITEVGVRGLENLIEQSAIQFTHWTPQILYFDDNQPGLHALGAGRLTSAAHTDPETSIKIGLDLLRDRPNKKERATILSKVRDLYIYADESLEHDAKELVVSAWEANKLLPLGLDSKDADICDLPSATKRLLCKCAEDLLEYKHIVSKQLTSTDKVSNLSFFHDCTKKINSSIYHDAFSAILKFENFPDLKRVFEEIDFPLKKAEKMRSSNNAQKFRGWLASATGGGDIQSISESYISSIVNKKGFLDKPVGKITKTAVMALAGAGVGALASPVGSAIGGVVGPLVSPAADIGLDLVDQFFLDGLLKGWSPKMFIDEVKGLKIPPRL